MPENNMIIHITATVVGGMLKPDETLQFADQTRVRLVIEPIGDQRDPVAAWAALQARLRARPIHGGGVRYTRDELHERR